eukprot:6170135-Prymnesium_polylepis.1
MERRRLAARFFATTISTAGSDLRWHSLHNHDVRACTVPSPVDESDIADPFPTGTRVDVWWPGDKRWYRASVLKTRTAWHSILRTKTLCREIFCDYELDGVLKFHSLHNTKVRVTDAGKLSASPYTRATLQDLFASNYTHRL